MKEWISVHRSFVATKVPQPPLWMMSWHLGYKSGFLKHIHLKSLLKGSGLANKMAPCSSGKESLNCAKQLERKKNQAGSKFIQDSVLMDTSSSSSLTASPLQFGWHLRGLGEVPQPEERDLEEPSSHFPLSSVLRSQDSPLIRLTVSWLLLNPG